MYRCLLNNLPFISSETPWEDLLDFRNNNETKKRLRKLRVWARELAKDDLNIDHIRELIEDSLSDYKEALRLAKMEYSTGVAETIVVGFASMVENVAKFKWEKVAKSLFSINKVNIDLANIELSAAGRELSFIPYVENKYKKS